MPFCRVALIRRRRAWGLSPLAPKKVGSKVEDAEDARSQQKVEVLVKASSRTFPSSSDVVLKKRRGRGFWELLRWSLRPPPPPTGFPFSEKIRNLLAR